MLKDKIDKDCKEALKQKQSNKISILRLLKSDMHNYMIEKKLKELKDEDIYEIIQKQIKRHQDSIEQFKKGQRMDLVKKEEEELQILKTYMPKALSEEELKSIIKEVIDELQPEGKRDFGKVMKAVMEKVRGRADGKTTSELVNKMLS